MASETGEKLVSLNINIGENILIKKEDAVNYKVSNISVNTFSCTK